MKYLTNTIKIWVMMLLAMTWNACTEDVDFDPVGQANGEQVYFSNSQKNRISLSKDKNSFSVAIHRVNTAVDATVGIKASGNTTDYQVPNNVTFKAGESVASVVIGYNPSALEYEVFSKLTLQIEDVNYTTPYGDSAFTFEVGIPAPFTSMGKGYYRDGFICSLYGLESLLYEVEIQKNDVKEGVYRLVAPYGKQFPYYSYGMADTSKPYYLEIDASDPDCVFIPFQSTGFQLGQEGIAYAYSMAGYAIAAGKDKEYVKSNGWAGTLKDGMITFPQEELIVNFTGNPNPSDSNPFYTGNINGEFLVVMPGTELTDYSVELAYKGFLINASNRGFALANITLGADVTSARVAVVAKTGAQDDLQKAVAGIVDGSIKSVEVETSGDIQVPCKKGGEFYMVAVTYNGDQHKEAGFIQFKVEGSDSGSAEVTPIEAYSGNYMLEGVVVNQDNTTQQVQVPVVMQHGMLDTGTEKLPAVFIKELLGMNGYKTMVPFLYDEVDGTLSMQPFEVTPYTDPQSQQTFQIIFSPLATGGQQIEMFTQGDALIGQLDEKGNLKFTNGAANKFQYDTFAFLFVQGQSAGIFSPLYDLAMARQEQAAANAQALKIQSNDFSGFTLKRIDATSINGFQLVDEEVPAPALNMMIKNCGEMEQQFIPFK